MSSQEALAESIAPPPGPAAEAMVLRAGDDGRALVRLAPGAQGAHGAPGEATVPVRSAVPGYDPAEGDRVLVTRGAAPGEWYAIGVLKSSRGPSVRAPSGATATVEGEALVLRDAAGRVAVVFDGATGGATVSAPAGDLHLSAPAGRVVVSAAEDVELRAGRDVQQFAGRALRAEAEKMAFTATQWLATAGRWEVRAARAVEKLQDAYRDVGGLMQTRAGRVRTLVRDTLQSVSRRTHITSKEDTSIDGKRVLLG